MLSDRSKSFQRHAQRVETIVAPGAALVLAVFGENFSQRQIAQFRFIAGLLGYLGWVWRYLLTQQLADHPITTFHWASAEAVRILG